MIGLWVLLGLVYLVLVGLLVQFLATTLVEAIWCLLLSPVLLPVALMVWAVAAIQGRYNDLDYVWYLTKLAMDVTVVLLVLALIYYVAREVTSPEGLPFLRELFG